MEIVTRGTKGRLTHLHLLTDKEVPDVVLPTVSGKIAHHQETKEAGASYSEEMITEENLFCQGGEMASAEASAEGPFKMEDVLEKAVVVLTFPALFMHTTADLPSANLDLVLTSRNHPEVKP